MCNYGAAGHVGGVRENIRGSTGDGGEDHWPCAASRRSSTFFTRYMLVSRKRSTQFARQLCSLREKPDEIEPTHLDGADMEAGAERERAR